MDESREKIISTSQPPLGMPPRSRMGSTGMSGASQAQESGIGSGIRQSQQRASANKPLLGPRSSQSHFQTPNAGG